jgi:hypothetical protein
VFERLRLFQLYANDYSSSSYLNRVLNPSKMLEEILQLSDLYWKNFISRLFTENCAVCVGVPNNKIAIEELLMRHQMLLKHKPRRSTELLKVG